MGILARAGIDYDDQEKSVQGHPGCSEKSHQPSFHIIEEPGGIRHMTECEVPTEEYNSARAKALQEKYPKMSAGVAEHLEALEPFLDVSIIAGFSYGVSKASVMVSEGKLLGHTVNREGCGHDPERTQAVDEFPPRLRMSRSCANS